MGVPFYFKKILNNYPDILGDVYSECGPCLFLDFNGIVHQCSHKVVGKSDFSHRDIFEAIKTYIYELDEMFHPKLIYAAIDGVAPLSKIKQQRQRRFKAAYSQDRRNEIMRKYGRVVSDWNSNCITPGTQFMKELNGFMRTVVRDLPKLIVSDSDEVGEGEHKMLNYIKKQPDKFDNIIIHGLDADLIFISLISNIPNITIYRDNVNEKSFLDVDVLKGHITRDMRARLDIEAPTERLIQDYVLICFLLGNDFLPKIISLDIIVSNGLNIIEDIYLVILNRKRTFLVNEHRQIDHSFLLDFIHELSRLEHKNINDANYRYIGKKYRNNKSLEGMEMELDKVEFYPLFNKTYINYNNMFDWKSEYYAHYFRHIDEKDSIIEEYLFGIQWILEYYLNGSATNNWYYPYLNSPLLEDLYLYLSKNKRIPVRHCCSTRITPEMQLLLVLPRSSHNLLPEKFRNVYHSELKYLYPTKFFIDTHLNTYLHQCIPFIPNFNLDKVLNYVSK